jgi:hypothetical protein
MAVLTVHINLDEEAMQLKAGRYLLLAGLILVAASALMAAGAAGALGGSVQQDGYTFADINASPSSGCIGNNITYSGSGASPDTQVFIFFLSDVPVVTSLQTTVEPSVQLEISGAVLGMTTSDGSGNWSFTAPVPATVERIQTDGGETGIQVPVAPGNWQILAFSASVQPGLGSLDPQQASYVALGNLDVLNCTVASSNTMPATGAPAAFLGAIGIGLLALGGLRLKAQRQRSARAS